MIKKSEKQEDNANIESTEKVEAARPERLKMRLSGRVSETGIKAGIELLFKMGLPKFYENNFFVRKAYLKN